VVNHPIFSVGYVSYHLVSFKNKIYSSSLISQLPIRTSKLMNIYWKEKMVVRVGGGGRYECEGVWGRVGGVCTSG